MPLEISMRHLEVLSVMLIVLMNKRLWIAFYDNVTKLNNGCILYLNRMNSKRYHDCNMFFPFTSRALCNEQPNLTKKEKRGEIYPIEL